MSRFKPKHNSTYNERLFGSGLRGALHRGRYKWINKAIIKHKITGNSILELGCFDGKVIGFLPDTPKRYLGLDANWEGGLEIAAELWKDFPEYEFRHCNDPKMMKLGDEVFDVSICLETFEHVPPEMVEPYLERLASATRNLVFISVPNEIGPIFIMKHLIKCLVGEGDRYSFSELFNQSLGRVDRVLRDQHKGFSWKEFESTVSRHFDILCVDGISPFIAGPYLSFGVGFVARPKKLR